MAGQKPKPAVDPRSAFLNVPYDSHFVDLYLAYIAGITAFGLIPRTTLEVPGGLRRLERIQRLIQGCRYSFHDLSRVEIDARHPVTPRFNMPFELGLAVMWADSGGANHTWFLFESRARRLEKSLSDLQGSDVYCHGGKPTKLFGELCNAMVRVRRQPTVQQIDAVYRALRKRLPDIMKGAGAKTPFGARVFADLRLAADVSCGHSIGSPLPLA
jgi:hypothetical protein